jgi:Zn finger protein HypA/HybF involved in hydrogenase expression
MSTKHVRTIGDVFRFKCGLKIECRKCFYSQTFDGQDLIRSLKGGQMTIDALRRRLKCSRCGGKDAKVIVLSPPPPRG